MKLIRVGAPSILYKFLERVLELDIVLISDAYADDLKVGPPHLMIDGHLLLHEFDELVLGLDGSLVLLLLNQQAQILIYDVGIPSIVIVFKHLLKEGLVDVECETLSFFIMVLFEQLHSILFESLLARVRVPIDLIEVLCLMQVLDSFGAIGL